MDSYKQYIIDYENGNIPVGELSIGSRITDPSWEWEFRTGNNYTEKIVHRTDGTYANSEQKPVTWIVVAKDHYSDLAPHVTLLSEELIGKFCFDTRKKNIMFIFTDGDVMWGRSGDSEADIGLRTWLNSTGTHSGEGFYASFSESFKDVVLTTNVPCRDIHSEKYTTQDNVFIPSTIELGEDFTWINDLEAQKFLSVGKLYPYYSITENSGAKFEEVLDRIVIKRVAKLAGDFWWYWTRSAQNVSFVNRVTQNGEFQIDTPTSHSGGVRPVLNIKSETLLSEA